MKKIISEWTVYILECSDGTFYTGVTNNLQKRINLHNAGKGAKYTRSRLPVKVIYQEDAPEKSEALKREYMIKQLSREQKIKLMHNSAVSPPLTAPGMTTR
jgi:predicted GIY-YIG superfamily endonuclease